MPPQKLTRRAPSPSITITITITTITPCCRVMSFVSHGALLRESRTAHVIAARLATSNEPSDGSRTVVSASRRVLVDLQQIMQLAVHCCWPQTVGPKRTIMQPARLLIPWKVVRDSNNLVLPGQRSVLSSCPHRDCGLLSAASIYKDGCAIGRV